MTPRRGRRRRSPTRGNDKNKAAPVESQRQNQSLPRQPSSSPSRPPSQPQQQSGNIDGIDDSASSSTFADALSETRSVIALPGSPQRRGTQYAADTISLSDSVMSLSSLLQPSTSEHARRQQRAGAALLGGADEDGAGGGYVNGPNVVSGTTVALDNVNSLTRTVTSWVKSATSLLLDPGIPIISSSINASSASTIPSRRTSAAANIVQRASPLASVPAVVRVVDATDSICSWPNCVQSLNIAVSRFHCRKCTGWYCGQHAGHASLGMKLLPATGEPDSRGIWSRVCQRCFQERLQVREHEPAPVRDHGVRYNELRSGYQLEAKNEARRLEHRYQTLASYHEHGRRGTGSHHASHNPEQFRQLPFRLFEQQVVRWEEDTTVKRCRQCQVLFGALQRKHHCRLCGQIICSDCSRFKPLPVGEGGEHELRVCGSCDWTLFRRLSILSALTDDHPKGGTGGVGISLTNLYMLYTQMRQVRRQISDIMPRFNEQLVRFEEEIDRLSMPRENRLKEARFEAATARDTLMLLYRHYEQLMRQMAPAGEGDGDERVIRRNIQRAALSYLQGNMFTLQMLPKLDLKRLQRPSSAASLPPSNSRASSIKGVLRTIGKGISSAQLSSSPRMPLPPPANMIALHGKREALEDQRGQLDGFLAEAAAAGRFDEVISLRGALEEVNQEMNRLDEIFRSYEHVQDM